MLILQALIRSVATNPVDEVNKETGKITPVWSIQTEHNDASGELQLQKLKAKSAQQAEAWRKLVGKTVNVPVKITASGSKAYLYMVEGQLPTASTPAA